MAILPTSSAWNPSVTGEEPRKAERCWRAKCYKPPQAFGPVPHWHHSSGWMGCLSGWWSMETDNLVSLAGRCYNANYLNMYCSSQINSRTTRQKTFWAKKNTVCEHKVSSDGPKFSYEYFKELRFNYSKGSIVSTMSFFLLNATISLSAITSSQLHVTHFLWALRAKMSFSHGSWQVMK